ncbi:glycoside hydrolase family 43 protein [Paenibacillus sp. UMB7766-LJ446]|uniref:glycoside hydrolase family 43 protein n=1 Tax=Paenibacillus sp. UMB7766-LJ446 TaxID=3046313 RepID=UPI00254F45FE|nr:glycoside hydrolase family 43 protein [Paenibacillus sp. UMB7766-LJ446]MDK8189761.1 glycoside hydrolase family 43 protein [Paenibacillus sp. UMB7766-LJ446]
MKQLETNTICYANPILPGFYPDPSIVKAEQYFYLICSSFEYFPGVPIFRSRDLIHWEQIGNVLNRVSQLDLTGRKSSDGIYAPVLRYHEGTFYMITTDVRGIGNFYVTATDPAGPWSDPIRIPYGGIDPSLFFDDDGKVYVTAQQGADYDSHAIQYEIDIATGEALSEPQVVWHGDGGPWTEGPHLYKINGLYYMMSASGGTAKEHREIIGRSDRPYGPFERYPDPILTHRHLDHPIQYLGHADLVEDHNGDWWAVFLGVRLTADGYSVLGRETFLAPVVWNEGWPHIDNNEGLVSLDMKVQRLPVASPSLPESHTAIIVGREEFDGELGLQWMYVRNPTEGVCLLTEKPGYLTLYCQAGSLDDIGQITFVGRRQQHIHASFTTCLSFIPAAEGEEAGLCVRRDEDAHYEIGIKRLKGRNVLFARLTVRGESNTVHESETVTERLSLRIESTEKEYRLACSEDGLNWTVLGSGSAQAISPEDFVHKMCFTGAVVGLYATGNGQASSAPARFDWFEYSI